MSKNSEMSHRGLLNVSSKNMDRHCVDVLRILKEQNIECNISPMLSLYSSKIKYNDTRVRWENGCKIEFFNVDKKDIHRKLWEPLKSSFDFNCAYLEDGYNFKGCIKKYTYQ